MDELFKMYVKTFLLSKGISCDGVSVDEMLGISAHVGEPKVGFPAWCDTMNVNQPEPEVTEDEIDDAVNSELNRCMFAAAAGSRDLQDQGILSIQKVS